MLVSRRPSCSEKRVRTGRIGSLTGAVAFTPVSITRGTADTYTSGHLDFPARPLLCNHDGDYYICPLLSSTA